MKPDETLLICCKSYQKECKNKYPGITIKKIPQMLLGRCEFGKDDYSLNIINSPLKELDQSDDDIETSTENISVQELLDEKKKYNKKAMDYPGLFD
jgi:adenine-specific DNA-methyltransferase